MSQRHQLRLTETPVSNLIAAMSWWHFFMHFQLVASPCSCCYCIQFLPSVREDVHSNSCLSKFGRFSRKFTSVHVDMNQERSQIIDF